MTALQSAVVKSAVVKSVIALAAVLTFAVPAHATMPVRPTLHVTTLDNPVKDFDVPRGLPTTWVINPDGKVAKGFLGPVTIASLTAVIGGK
ncbi:MAG: TlpA family protein disulfide reductase [Rhodanobacter sp.]